MKIYKKRLVKRGLQGTGHSVPLKTMNTKDKVDRNLTVSFSTRARSHEIKLVKVHNPGSLSRITFQYLSFVCVAPTVLYKEEEASCPSVTPNVDTETKEN